MMDLLDVLIIGGGPTGSSAASYLAMKGYKVQVLEKEKFPRDHVGESLIPFCYDKLKALGVLEQMNRIAVRKPGVNFVNAEGTHETTWCFRNVLKDESSLSYHMLRAGFDDMLLHNSRRLGAAVQEETTVQQVDLSDPDRVTVETNGVHGRQQFQARFLLDASGQNAFVASRLGTKVAFEGLDRVAFFCHWRNNQFDNALLEGLIKIVYLGGEKKGWCWMIPVGPDHISIGVTLNNAYVKERKAALQKAGDADWKTTLYTEEIFQSPVIRNVLTGAHRDHDVLTLGDYSYRSETKYGVNYALIGDAGAFLDPIFSSGIYVGMHTADTVAQALDVKFKQGAAAGAAAFEETYKHIDGAYRLLEKFIRLFYEPETINFATLGSPEQLLYTKFERAYTILHHLLAGDFFTNYERYIPFIDMIREEKTFNKYYNLIRNQEQDFGKGSCGETFDAMYGGMDAHALNPLPDAR